MKNITFILALFVLLSCSKKEIQIPKIPLNGKEKIQNHSSIWMFNNEGKLKLNEKNRISSTHWFFNIDKNLPLLEFLPEVIRLRIKHNEKSPHNTKKMDNYYSYANSLNDKLSFYQFDDIDYQFIKKSKLPTFKSTSDTILIINIKKEDLVKIKDKKVVKLAYSRDLIFQKYLMSKAIIVNDSLKIENKEYIFD